jgi:hypothetical protein
MEMHFSEESPMGIFSCEIFFGSTLSPPPTAKPHLCNLFFRQKKKGKMEEDQMNSTEL